MTRPTPRSARLSNVDDTEMPALTFRVGIGAVYDWVGRECLFQLPSAGSAGHPARTRTRLVPHRKTRDAFATDNDVPIAAAYSLAGMIWWTGVERNRVQLLAQPRSVEHQGACAGVHHGKRRSREPVRAQRDCRRRGVLRYQTRLLVQSRHRPCYTAHRIRSRGTASAVPRLTRKHGLAAEPRRMHAAQHSTRRGRLGDEWPLAISVLSHGLRRVVLCLLLHGFERVQLGV